MELFFQIGGEGSKGPRKLYSNFLLNCFSRPSSISLVSEHFKLKIQKERFLIFFSFACAVRYVPRGDEHQPA
jgi:hypothetical protein